MTFRLPSCRAFSRVAHNLTLILVGLVCLISIGVILHSNWVMWP
jgi:hypothetical protein